MSHIFGNHHAYLVLGNITTTVEFIKKSLSVDQKIYEHAFELLGVEELREFKVEYQGKASYHRSIIVSAERVSTGAQNALLKMIEEPVENITLFFVFPPHITVLNTILSRVITITAPSNYTNLLFPIKDFLQMDYKKRLDAIEDLSKDRKKNSEEAFQSYEVQEFLDALEFGFALLFKKNHSLIFTQSFQAIRQARVWSTQTGFPQKNILDYIAIQVVKPF
jgi:DNA polymerase III delta prime subunit